MFIGGRIAVQFRPLAFYYGESFKISSQALGGCATVKGEGMSIRNFLESSAHRAANLAWPVLRRYIDRRDRKPFQPKWADGNLQPTEEQVQPILGWPRETDSLCPTCVQEVREAILCDEEDWQVLLGDHPGEIKATIRERDGQIVMDKTCPRHGSFSDLMSMDPKFLQRIEDLHRGSDFLTTPTELRNHGKSTMKLGRGSVMTLDLTNRCNMMCDACFMDANQVGYVHELNLDEVKKILDDAISVKPKRQMSINFSGGEPTIAPTFLDAIRYATEVGFFTIQCSTNGIRFAQEPEFAFAAKEAGLRLAYLQFDGVNNDDHAHRKVGEFYDLKLKAMENLKAADIDTVLVPTIINTVNDAQVGPIVDFAIEHSDKVSVISFQPISFTGRDEEISEEDRLAQRFTLSHLAHAVSEQTGLTDPHLDWFPLSALSPFSDLVDILLGHEAEFGSLKCGCHPNCGVGSILFVNKETKEAVPMSKIINLDQLLQDVREIADSQQGRSMSITQMGVALLKNYNTKESPIPFTLLLKQFLSQMGALDFAGDKDADDYQWRILFVAGMWFQDLFNYDFRRTERCIIPYGTQMGEISFCAYNTGVGWRHIVEKIHQVATVQDWYKDKGRHTIYANGEPVPMSEPTYAPKPAASNLVSLKFRGSKLKTPQVLPNESTSDGPRSSVG